jgi:phosphatidate cytidylyltransferase
MALHKLRLTAELQKRILVSAILGPIVLLLIMLGGSLYNLLVVLVCTMMCSEWSHIIYSEKKSDRQFLRWQIAGIVYVTIFGSSLLYLRSLDGGAAIVLFMFLVVWAIDIAAYFAGKIIGGPKLAPKISPNKTWAGLIGGMVGASLVTIFTAIVVASMGIIEAVILAVVLTIIAQAGDFYESWVKRQFNLKDSGQLLPGHGGLLDRLDGVVAVAPVVVFMVIIKGGSLFT